MKRMLINATQKEEFRIALVDGQYLYDLDIETGGKEQKKANIYKGVITKVNPSLEAAFVAYGGERDGFLPLKEIADSYFTGDRQGKRNIKDLKEGQEVLVQIEKEIRGKKGAALTTYISLAGSFLVLKPNEDNSGGISRHIQGRSRIDLKKQLNALKVPKGMSVIARTASLEKSAAELQQDLDALICYWNEIKEESKKNAAPVLIHKEIDVITRVFRDYLRDDISEILLDNEAFFEKAKHSLMDLGRADFIEKLHLYTGDIALFTHFQIENQIESAFLREVRLKSGGSIVIDVTEALTAIDINSSKSNKGADIEETALTTNLEAAEEIARQLRFRDLGGLIVIDFIDMRPFKNQKAVEDCLKEHIKSDRARIQVTKISRFGLLEMSRQRVSSSLKEAAHHICPRCEGTGTIRDNNSLSLSILRLIQEAALKDHTAQVEVIVPVEIASYLLNEKRAEVAQIEANSVGVKVIIAADSQMDTPAYKLIRKRVGDESGILSYQLPRLVRDQAESEMDAIEAAPKKEEALLTGVKIESAEARKPSVSKIESKKDEKQATEKPLLARFMAKVKAFFNGNEPEEKTAEAAPARSQSIKSEKEVAVQVERKKSINRSPQRHRTAAKEARAPLNQEPETRQKTAAPVHKTEKAPMKPPVTKPRRERRMLTQSVRVQEESVALKAPTSTEKPKVVAPINVAKPAVTFTVDTVELQSMPSLLNSVLLFETTKKENAYKVRPRRTLRHLRMNNQRKRRQNADKNNAMLTMNHAAAAALEVSLCRVYVYAYLAETDKGDKTATAILNYPKMGQLLQAVTDFEIPTILDSAIQTNAHESNVANTMKPENTTVDFIAGRNHAYAPMAKAPAIVENHSPCTFKWRAIHISNRHRIKGAGALCAKEHAFCPQSHS